MTTEKQLIKQIESLPNTIVNTSRNAAGELGVAQIYKTVPNGVMCHSIWLGREMSIKRLQGYFDYHKAQA